MIPPQETTSRSPSSFPTLDGSNGFVIPGLVSQSRLSTAVGRPGDVQWRWESGDILLAAYGADVPGRASAGQAYVIFGRASFPASFDLASLNGSNGFTVNGNATFDSLGYSVEGAGDVNDDGFADFVIGATGVDGSGLTNSGAAYVIFGKASSFTATLEVSTLNGSNGFALLGVAALDGAGTKRR